MFKRGGSIAAILVILFASTRLFASCPELREADNAKLIAFLADDKAKAIAEKSDCVTYALTRLGEAKSGESVAVVSDYLDYKRPLTADEAEMEKLHIAMHSKEFYPAVLALFQIGKPALPALIDKIGHKDTSGEMLENAVRATMMIFRENPSNGIRFLKSSAEKSTDPIAAARIEKAINPALRWCGISRQEECKAVLKGGSLGK